MALFSTYSASTAAAFSACSLASMLSFRALVASLNFFSLLLEPGVVVQLLVLEFRRVEIVLLLDELVLQVVEELDDLVGVVRGLVGLAVCGPAGELAEGGLLLGGEDHETLARPRRGRGVDLGELGVELRLALHGGL